MESDLSKRAYSDDWQLRSPTRWMTVVTECDPECEPDGRCERPGLGAARRDPCSVAGDSARSRAGDRRIAPAAEHRRPGDGHPRAVCRRSADLPVAARGTHDRVGDGKTKTGAG